MSPQLDAIWQQIQTLPDADRLALEERLQEFTDQQWRQEATAAREIARERGIDQSFIDDAVEQFRYGL